MRPAPSVDESPAAEGTPEFIALRDVFRVVPWPRVARIASLAVPLVVVTILNTWGIGDEGWGNQFYAAGTRSMSETLHAFIFASVDRGGFISVDKPPLAFWTQALFVRVLGWHPITILLPSILAGAGVVAVVYLMVRWAAGWVAAGIAALTAGTTPVAIAVFRSNNTDAVLVLLLAVITALFLRYVSTGRAPWLLSSAVVLGLAAMTKGFAAALVVPALVLTAWCCVEGSAAKRLRDLALFAVVAGVVASAWMFAVDAVPAHARPFVGGSTTNSEVNLQFVYNGFGRLGGGVAGQTSAGPVRLGDSGTAGPLRLLTAPVGGQASWLLALAALGALAVWIEAGGWAGRKDRRMALVLLSAVSVVTYLGAFSLARGLFHAYYVAPMTVPIACLVGAGVVSLARLWRNQWWWLVPTTVLAQGALSWLLLSGDPYLRWLGPVDAAVSVGCSVVLVVVRHRDSRGRPYVLVTMATAVAVGSIAPLTWAWSVPRASGATAAFPEAGPPALAHKAALTGTRASLRARSGRDWVQSDPIRSPGGALIPPLAKYLSAHGGRYRWIVATPDGPTAYPLIIRADLSVASLGGYGGGDPAITADRFAALVADRQVRFFLTPTLAPPGATVPVREWVNAHCAVVPSSAWAYPGARPTETLYDCRPGDS